MTTTVRARRSSGQQVTISTPTPEVAREVARTLRWPRPRLVHDHATLFVQPVYQDGQPYTDDDLEDDD